MALEGGVITDAIGCSAGAVTCLVGSVTARPLEADAAGGAATRSVPVADPGRLLRLDATATPGLTAGETDESVGAEPTFEPADGLLCEVLPEPVLSAEAIGIAANAEPTPNATASAPTRPT
jgi:hypothetical protein